MKKILLSTALVVALAASMSSCKKSVECCDSGYCVTVSRSDYPTPGAYEAYVNTLKASGYTCK